MASEQLLSQCERYSGCIQRLQITAEGLEGAGVIAITKILGAQVRQIQQLWREIDTIAKQWRAKNEGIETRAQELEGRQEAILKQSDLQDAETTRLEIWTQSLEERAQLLERKAEEDGNIKVSSKLLNMSLADNAVFKH
jgi:hypothetical protein